MKKIGWDISHQEFTIEDHYYFSTLKNVIIKSGGIVQEISDIGKIKKFDVLVINYPEKLFKKEEISLIERFMLNGGKVIVLGYYQNEDNVASAINSLTTKFGLSLNHDAIIDESNNHGDKYFVITQRILKYNSGTKKVLMPCSASIEPDHKNGYTIVIGEETARTTSNNSSIMAAETSIGKGKLILLGTCVFWDNFSILKYDNLKFAKNILFE